MPGKKKKKSSHKKRKGNGEGVKRELVFKQFGEEYAVVIKKLGDRRLTVKLPSGEEQMAIIPGRFRRRCWFNMGDVALVSHREFQSGKLDVLYKYTVDEARELIRCEEIPKFFLGSTDSVGAGKEEDDEGDFAFDFAFDDI
jgi:initiation factor 1A